MVRFAVALEDNGKIRCDACPVLCYIKDGRTGACDRYANDGGELVRVDAFTILQRNDNPEAHAVPFLLDEPLEAEAMTPLEEMDATQSDDADSDQPVATPDWDGDVRSTRDLATIGACFARANRRLSAIDSGRYQACPHYHPDPQGRAGICAARLSAFRCYAQIQGAPPKGKSRAGRMGLPYRLFGCDCRGLYRAQFSRS